MLALELANVYRIWALSGKVYVRCIFTQVARATASLVHLAYGGSIHVYIQPPPSPLCTYCQQYTGYQCTGGPDQFPPPSPLILYM